MKRLVMTLALTGVLSLSVSAGDIPTGESPAPAPSPTPQGISMTSPSLSAPGDMSTGDSPQPMLDPSLSAFLWVLGLVV